MERVKKKQEGKRAKPNKKVKNSNVVARSSVETGFKTNNFKKQEATQKVQTQVTKRGELLIPAFLEVPTSSKKYNDLLIVFENLMDEGAGKRNHPKHKLYNVIAVLLDDYDRKIDVPGEVTGVEMLEYLMEEQGLKQRDLVDVFGSESTVSYVLNGKRSMTLDQIKKLAKKFNVNPGTFI